MSTKSFSTESFSTKAFLTKAFCSTLLFTAAAFSAPVHGQTLLSGQVDDTNFGPLRRGQEYVTNTGFTVPANRTLTIEPGVVIKFARSRQVSVFGKLVAVGTVAEPIVWTSIHDHSVGSNTGTGTPARGDWLRMFFGGRTDSVMRFAEVRFAGGNNRAGIACEDSNLTLRRVVVRDCGSDGIRGLRRFAQPLNNRVVIDGCEIRNCGGVAVTQFPVDMLGVFTDNQASGNDRGDYYSANSISMKVDTVIGRRNTLNGLVGVIGTFSINQGVRMTVAAGLAIKLRRSTFFSVNSGTLELNGTAAQPITVTSLEDDSVLGDTQKDGPPPGIPARFNTIEIGSNNSVIRHAVIRFGGNAAARSGAVFVAGAATPRIEDTVIEFSRLHGICLNGQLSSPVVERCVLRDNGLRAIGPAISFNTVAKLRDNVAMRNGGGNHLELGSFPRLDGSASVFLENTLNQNGVLVLGSLSLGRGKRLELGPGLILKMLGGGFTASGGDLVMEGRGDAPIVVTSHRDDTRGGDTNRDGAATQPAPGDWSAIVIGSLPTTSSIAHVHCLYGGRARSETFFMDSGTSRATSVRVDRSRLDGMLIANLRGVAANLVAFKNGRDGIVLPRGAHDVQHATSTANIGAGLRATGNYLGQVSNSISWRNGTRDSDNYVGFMAGAIVSSNGLRVRGNIFDDPGFRDPVNGDLRISPFGLSVRQADLVKALRWGVDFDGNSRVLDHADNGLALPDMGAYEVFRYRMAVRGLPRVGTTMEFTVGGPGPATGVQAVFVGPGVGGMFVPPFGVLLTGSLSNSVVIGVQANKSKFGLPIPMDTGLIGERFGLQIAAIGKPTLPAGNLCNAFLAAIRR